MLGQQSTWIIATVSMWRRSNDFKEDDPNSTDPYPLKMGAVEGTSGRFETYDRRAANELTAALFIFLLIWVWNCANYRAKMVNRGSVSCKLTRREFSGAFPLVPAWLLPYRVFA